jgi:uncharacterized protein
MNSAQTSSATVERLTRHWLEKSVIGLNLCPFAKAPYSKDLVRFVVSDAGTDTALMACLTAELALLDASARSNIETTIIVHPQVLNDFYDYHFFVSEAERLLVREGYEGVLQIASFHPQYLFSGVAYDDPTNNTNRSPYPMLHILREDSISEVQESKQDADRITERNCVIMTSLGNAGYLDLLSS